MKEVPLDVGELAEGVLLLTEELMKELLVLLLPTAGELVEVALLEVEP